MKWTSIPVPWQDLEGCIGHRCQDLHHLPMWADRLLIAVPMQIHRICHLDWLVVSSLC